MATASDDIRATVPEPPAVRRADGPKPSCSECRFHIPHLTRPGGWCACDVAELKWHVVAAGRPLCRDFAPWPENGDAAWAFAEMQPAMRPHHPHGGGRVY